MTNQPQPQQSGPRHPARTEYQEREIHDYISGHKAAIVACPTCDWRRKEVVRLAQLLPIRVRSPSQHLMAMIETPEYKAAVDRHLAGDSQKGEPMAQTDSDTLAKRIDEHDIQHDAVQKHLASLEDQIAELSKQQADSHAAILNALQQLSQPSPTASPAAQPTTTKE